MKFNLIIPKGLKEAYQKELELYLIFYKTNNLSKAWFHLERSHILGQSYPIEHTYSHWLMLKFGFRKKDFKEVFGQLIRLSIGGWKSFINHVPLGNTGGSNIHPLRSMSLPEDIRKTLEYYKK